MKPLNKKALSLLMAGVLAAGFAATAHAFTFQTNWPPSPMGTDIKAHPTIDYGVKYLYEWGVGLGGVAVFIVLVMAGFQYITSVGDPTKMKEAFRRIEEAVVGLLILLSSYALLNFAGVDLKQLKINLFDPSTTSPIKTCTGTEGDPEPECCTDASGAQIANCDPSFWTCAGSTGTDKGYCMLNTKTESCSKVVIKYTDAQGQQQGSMPIVMPDAEQKTFDADMIATGMERYYRDDDGHERLCYDTTNPNAKDLSANRPCNCIVQIYTKTMATSASDSSTQPCANNDGVRTTVNTADFSSSNSSTRIICVAVIAPQAQ